MLELIPAACMVLGFVAFWAIGYRISRDDKPKSDIKIPEQDKSKIPQPTLTPWSLILLERYYKLPVELRPVEITPLLKAKDASILDPKSMKNHWGIFHSWGLSTCMTDYGTRPGTLDDCPIYQLHKDTLEMIVDLEEQAKERARAEKMLEASYDIERMPGIIASLKAEVQIAAEVTKQMNDIATKENNESR